MIKVSKLTDYATVIMSYLAREPNRLASATQISKAIDVSAPTVSKILKMLAEAELVTSFRGADGGYQLSRPVDQISVADIISALEGKIAITECCEKNNLCSINVSCAIKSNWKKINSIIYDVLQQITLHDMTHSIRDIKVPIRGKHG